jgi:light-regulated signal transduction histidine kinase (bacteriophytochrome)
MLESANKVDGFAFMASHDLKKPRKIQTFTELLENKYGSAKVPDAGKYLKSIDAAAKRMDILIKDLLAFSRVSSDNHSLADCDLNQVLQEVIDDLETKIFEKKAIFHIDTLPTIPGNENLLRSLFFNLIENALKYSRKDIPPIINIGTVSSGANGSSSSGSKTGKYCRVQVEDNGIGFEQKYAEHIFNMFRRLHNVVILIERELDWTSVKKSLKNTMVIFLPRANQIRVQGLPLACPCEIIGRQSRLLHCPECPKGNFSFTLF